MVPDDHATIYERSVMRELSRLLGSRPRGADVLAARADLGHDAYTVKLMAEANIEEAAVLNYSGSIHLSAVLYGSHRQLEPVHTLLTRSSALALATLRDGTICPTWSFSAV